jgi:hypothetical protein
VSNEFKGTNWIFTHLFPSRDLSIAPDPRDIIISRRLSSNKRSLGNEQGAGKSGALLIVLDREVAVNVLLVCTEASERGHDDTVSEGDFSQLERGEELGSCSGSHGRVKGADVKKRPGEPSYMRIGAV